MRAIRLVGWRVGLAIAILIFGSALTQAQISYGNLRGTVTEATGSVVAGAKVTLTEPSTGIVTRQVVTDGSGNYELSDLKPSTYVIKVESEGFEDFIAQNVVLDPGQTRRIDAKLSVKAAASETTTVVAGASVIETESGTISDTIQQNEIKNSPLGDNFPSAHALLATLPGIQGDGGGYGLTIHGMDWTQQVEQIDGTPNDKEAGNINLTLFVDGVTVDTLNPPADSAGPAYFNTTSKHGSNEFHGSLNYKMINNGLNATPWTGMVGTKDKLVLHQGQGEIGGPIWKNKTFFYVSYYTQIVKQDSLNYATVPTAAMRAGDLSAFGNFKNPTSCVAGAGGSKVCSSTVNAVPSMNSVSAAVQSYYPNPMSSLGDPNVFASNNFNWTHPYPEDSYKFTFFPVLRIDHNLTSKNSFYVRWLPRTTPYILSQGLPAPFLDTIQRNSAQFNFADTHVFSAAVVNNFRFSWQPESYHTGVNLDGKDPLRGGDVVSKIGLQGVNPAGTNIQGFPTMSIGNAGLGGVSPTSMSETGGGLTKNKDFVYGDDVTWQFGRHVLKIGGDLLTFNVFSGVSANYGSFSFNGKFSGNAYADFLLGLPSSDSRSEPLINRTRVSNELGLYATDTFKISPRLVLTYGLRWDYYGTQKYTDGLMYRFDPTSGNVIIPASKASLVNPLYPSNIPVSTSGQVLPNNDLLNFRPRVSFAYNLGHDAVIRGGYGQYTERLDNSYVGLASGAGPFAHYTESYTNCLADPSGKCLNSKTPAGTPLAPLFSFPNPFPANMAANPVSSQSVAAFPTQWNNGIYHQYNLTLEKQVKDNGFRVTYVGTRGRGLNYHYNGNIEPVNADGYDSSLTPYPIFNSVTLYKHDGGTNYDALETEVKKRTGWFTFDANYTWLSSLSNCAACSSNPTSQTANPLIENIMVPTKHWFVDYQERRNMFDLTTTWDVPFGKGRKYLGDASTLLNLAVGGWTVQTVSRIGSPTYDTPVMSAPYDTANDNYAAQLPDMIPGQKPNLPKSQRTNLRYWNMAQYTQTGEQVGPDGNTYAIYTYSQTGAFMVPGATPDDPLCLNMACVMQYVNTGVGPGRYGNACISCLETQNLFTHHLNVSKDIRIDEKRSFRYTASFLNLFNHPHFYDPDNWITDSTAGQMLWGYGSDLDFFSDKSGYRKIEMGVTLSF